MADRPALLEINERPRRQFRARFFVASDGATIEKAPPLKVSERRAIFDRDGWACQYCGTPVAWLAKECYPYVMGARSTRSPGAVDHVLPRARGGQNAPSNLVLACRRCNSSKQVGA